MNNSYRSVWRTDSALRQYMYFLVMSQHTIHYDMNINEPRQCCFDSGDSLTGFVLQPISLISMASVVQVILYDTLSTYIHNAFCQDAAANYVERYVNFSKEWFELRSVFQK